MAEFNLQGVGKTGAPFTGGVSPGLYGLLKAGGAFVGMPMVMLASRGIVVPVSNGGGPVGVVAAVVGSDDDGDVINVPFMRVVCVTAVAVVGGVTPV